MAENHYPDTILEDALRIADLQAREAYLDEVSGDDEELRREVESLLAAHFAAGGFMEGATAPWEELAEQPGDRIGHYKLLELIGEGGFGRVWMAEQTEPVRRRVALKVIKPGMDSKQVMARFEAERQALALMDHPHIAHIHEAGATEQGRPYFVMELVVGIPLTRYCAERNLDTTARLELFLDVCSAVQHAHQKGIIHRDLKPFNILVSPHDCEPVVKVIDFGIAKAIGMELTEKTVFTSLGRLIGTPQYMSPEQAELNALDVDTRSDVYSLGVLLYELLTGRTPLDGEKLRSAGYDEMRRLIREEEPPKPSTRISELRTHTEGLSKEREAELRALQSATAHDLDWIVLKALEKERQRRYQTADSFADDLRRYLADEAVEARPPSVLYRWEKVAKRHRGGIAAAAAIIVILVAGAATSTYLAVTAIRAKREAEREAAINKAVNDFINKDLFRAADPDEEPDRDLKVRTVLDRASASIEGRFADQPLVESSIRETLAKTYVALGEHAEAERHLERCLELKRVELGKGHLDVIKIQHGLAMLQGERSGDHSDAARLCALVLERSRAELGPRDPETLMAMRNLGADYILIGRDEEAWKMLRETLDLQREVLGPDHADTLGTLRNLGSLAALVPEHLEEALAILEEGLQLAQRVYGREHPETLSTMNAFAVACLQTGRNDVARKVFERTLELQQKVLGENHPSTLTSLRNLGVAEIRTGRTEQAIRHFTLHLQRIAKARGAEHRFTLASKSNLAAAYHEVGQKLEAVEIWEEILESRRRALDSDHPDILESMLQLAKGYASAGRHEEVLRLGKEALELHRTVRDPKHPDMLALRLLMAEAYGKSGLVEEEVSFLEETSRLLREAYGAVHRKTLSCQANLGAIHMKVGRLEAAGEIIEETLKLQRKVLDSKDPSLLRSLSNQALLFYKTGRGDDAVRIWEETLQLSREGLGLERPETLKAMHNLTIGYAAVGRTEDALTLGNEALQLHRKVLGREHPDTLEVLLQRINLYMESARAGEALSLLEEAVPLSVKVLGLEHRHSLACMTNLGVAYMDVGRHDEARTQIEKALKLQHKVLGPEHPDTLRTADNLAAVSHEAIIKTIDHGLFALEELQDSPGDLREHLHGSDNPERSGAEDPSGIVARVNGKIVLKSEVEFHLAPIVAMLQARYPRRGEQYERELGKAKKQVFQRLVDQQIELGFLETLELEVPDLVIDRDVERVFREVFKGDEEEFDKQLKDTQLTRRQFRVKRRESYLLNLLRDQVCKEVPGPTPDEIKRHFEVRRDELRDESKDLITFQKIFLPAKSWDRPDLTREDQRELAEKLAGELRAGADFGELAEDHSEGFMAKNGGFWKGVPRSDLAPGFAQIVWESEIGSIIGPLQDRQGFTIVKVLEIKKAPVPKFDEVQERLRQEVEIETKAAHYQEWIRPLRAASAIEQIADLPETEAADNRSDRTEMKGISVPGTPGFIFNPWTGTSVDVRGIPPGSLVRDPLDPDHSHVIRVPMIPTPTPDAP